MKFKTPVHFGSGNSARNIDSGDMCFLADTFFSALCHSTFSVDGGKGIETLYAKTKSGSLLFSDSMPCIGESLYIPKPAFTFKKNTQKKSGTDSADRKKLKKLQYIPIAKLTHFIKSVNTGREFVADEDLQDFGKFHISQKVKIEGSEDSEPYSVNLFSFNDNCGLYVIVAFEYEEDFEYVFNLVKNMSFSGIGGKVSSGYGKFELDGIFDSVDLSEPFGDFEILSELLNSSSADKFISLTSSLPTEDELDLVMKDASYTVTRRGGFVYSNSYGDTLMKKKTQYYFGAGSVFSSKFKGDVFDVSDSNGKHPVYRYGKPIFLGVTCR